MPRYNPKDVEPKWRAAWAEAGIFRAENGSDKPKYYVMEMFPYPSGRLHVGHARNYAMGDVVARFKRARGFNVLHPMGWDAFGLPAENAAAERGVDPAAWTYDNIDLMRAELQRLGVSIDWSREFATCDPAYYGQQQAWFLKLWKRGLVYRKEGLVNWDPVDMTVLANEQVIDGRGWRSDAPVERRKLNQWFLRITDYADELLESLKTLDRWPEKVRADAGELDRQVEGPAPDLPVRGRRPARASATASPSTPPGPDTLYRRELRGAVARPPADRGAGRRRSARRRLRRGMPQGRHLGGRDRDRREAGLRHRAAGAPPVRPDLAPAGLDRELHPDGLRHRGHLRLPGARPARPRLRPQVRACRSRRWCCRPARTPRPFRSATRPTSTRAASSTRTSWTGSTSRPPRPRRSRAPRA